MNTLAVAVRCQMSLAWVRRLRQRLHENCEVAPWRPIKKMPPKWDAYADELKLLVEQQADMTVRELRQQLSLEVRLQTLSVALRRLKYNLKKSPQGERARPARCRAESGLVR
jgi:transposase